MKRFFSALVFCVSLLLLLSFFLFPPVKAKENILIKLLELPAPPPPNPLVHSAGRDRGDKFYGRNNPPKDDAPIDDLLDYWLRFNGESQGVMYNVKPSDKVVD